MTRTLKITGFMKGDGKAEALRIGKLLEKRREANDGGCPALGPIT